jgi:hypothetical protein
MRIRHATEPSMPYLLLILEPRGQRASRTDAEGRAVYDRMLQSAAALKSRGVLRGAESLRADDEASRVRVRNGRSEVVDGPFSESKEMVGGYFLLDCATREEALAIAREVPAAEWATIEVRELGPCFT